MSRLFRINRWMMAFRRAAEGRKLAGITTASNSGWFIYNDEGMRTIKYFEKGSSEYYLDGSNIMREVRSNDTGSDILDFFYDDQGNLFGFQYDEDKY